MNENETCPHGGEQVDCMECAALGMCDTPKTFEAREWKKYRQGVQM
jgi:hypothetical protein